MEAEEDRAADALQRERQLVDDQHEQAREAQAQHNLMMARTEAAKVRAPEKVVPVYYGGKMHQKVIENSFNKQNGKNKAASSHEGDRAFGALDRLTEVAGGEIELAPRILDSEAFPI